MSFGVLVVILLTSCNNDSIQPEPTIASYMESQIEYYNISIAQSDIKFESLAGDYICYNWHLFLLGSSEFATDTFDLKINYQYDLTLEQTQVYMAAYPDTILHGEYNGLTITHIVKVVCNSPTAVVLDGDGNSYETVTIGDQTWLQTNLVTTSFNDGTEIFLAEENLIWENFGFPSFCWPHNKEIYKDSVYGAYYNAYVTIHESKNVCPVGYRIPKTEDWDVLFASIQPNGQNTVSWDTGAEEDNILGGILKATSTNYWRNPNIGAIDYFGFSLVGAGFRNSDGSFIWAPEGDFGKAFSYSPAINQQNELCVVKAENNIANIVAHRFTGPSNGLPIRCIQQ